MPVKFIYLESARMRQALVVGYSGLILEGLVHSSSYPPKPSPYVLTALGLANDAEGPGNKIGHHACSYSHRRFKQVSVVSA